MRFAFASLSSISFSVVMTTSFGLTVFEMPLAFKFCLLYFPRENLWLILSLFSYRFYTIKSLSPVIYYQAKFWKTFIWRRFIRIETTTLIDDDALFMRPLISFESLSIKLEYLSNFRQEMKKENCFPLKFPFHHE